MAKGSTVTKQHISPLKVNPKKLSFRESPEETQPEPQQPPTQNQAGKRRQLPPSNAPKKLRTSAQDIDETLVNLETANQTVNVNDDRTYIVQPDPVNVYEDLSRYPKLHVLNIRSLMEAYAKVETGHKKMASGKRVAYRTIDKHVKSLKRPWKLLTVSIFSKLIYADSRQQSLEKTLKLLAHDISKYLRKETETSGNVLKDYQKYHVFFRPFEAFRPLTTATDEQAYRLEVLAKNRDGKWKRLAQIILGSLGLHESESVYAALDDEDFSYFPFVLGDRESLIHNKIYEYLHQVHDGSFGLIKFSAVDMWRVASCLVLFCARKRFNKKPVLLLTLTVGPERIMKKLLINGKNLLPLVDRCQEGKDNTDLMTTEMVETVRGLILYSYEDCFKRTWSDDAVVMEKVQTGECLVGRDGQLQIVDPSELICFLYFYGRYHTCSFIHQKLSLNFDATLVGADTGGGANSTLGIGSDGNNDQTQNDD